MSKLSRIRPRVRTILVVDDEVDILLSLTELFQTAMEGVEVLTARDGPTALELLQRHPVDAIVCDYRMPGMDGLEVLSRASEAAPDVPRIMLTAYPDLELAMRAINEAHIENFLTKPVRGEKLLEAVNAALLKVRQGRDRPATAPPRAPPKLDAEP
jgi:response regulator RpfG family c-di-GMP phosphodiesterase